MLNIFKIISRFLREYKLFGLVVLTVIVSLILEFTGQKTIAHWLLAVVSIASVVPLLKDMWEDLQGGTYGIDILAATAIIASVILGQYWAGIVVVAMLTGGEALEDYASRRAKIELGALLSHAPSKAHLIRGRKTIDVAVKDIKVGDKFIVKPGEIVPADAIILEGSSDFDESSLTGESLPKPGSKGDRILSGSTSINGAVTARATQSAASSQYEQIVKLVQAAAASQARFVRLADRYSVPFTAIAYAIGLAVWISSGQAIRFLEVIIVATPCPLILAAPIAFISGMSRASKFGIIVKTGAALEKLAMAKTIAFDKTGTLTLGNLEVDNVKAFNSFKQADVLSIAASLEKSSNHVLAQAIVRAAESKKVKTVKAKQVNELAGHGLKATLKGKEILVGRLSFIEENNVGMPAGFVKKSWQQTATYVSVDGELAGIISFRDEVRPETKTTLSRLKKLGIKHIMMITGDSQAAAQSIAKKLGIKDVKAEALPAEKLHAIESLPNRPVAFVGDGVNDAPVLTAADVGVALGARGSTAASESADVVIMLDDLSRLAKAISIAKRSFSVAKQSVLIGIFISVGLMAVFATGHFKPIVGAVLQEVVDVVVIFNALRAHTAGKNESI